MKKITIPLITKNEILSKMLLIFSLLFFAFINIGHSCDSIFVLLPKNIISKELTQVEFKKLNFFLTRSNRIFKDSLERDISINSLAYEQGNLEVVSFMENHLESKFFKIVNNEIFFRHAGEYVSVDYLKVSENNQNHIKIMGYLNGYNPTFDSIGYMYEIIIKKTNRHKVTYFQYRYSTINKNGQQGRELINSTFTR